MELLLFFALIFLMINVVFKVSIGLVRLALGLVGALLIIVLLPVGIALIVPVGILVLFVGLLKLIF